MSSIFKLLFREASDTASTVIGKVSHPGTDGKPRRSPPSPPPEPAPQLPATLEQFFCSSYGYGNEIAFHHALYSFPCPQCDHRLNAHTSFVASSGAPSCNQFVLLEERDEYGMQIPAFCKCTHSYEAIHAFFLEQGQKKFDELLSKVASEHYDAK